MSLLEVGRKVIPYISDSCANIMRLQIRNSIWIIWKCVGCARPAWIAKEMYVQVFAF